jgi:YfiH family protein
VAENRRRLAAALGLSAARIAIGRQVHGAELVASQPPLRCSLALDIGEKEQRSGQEVPEADGQVVSEPGFAALVFVADCVPVALAGSGGVAMLHCGWRGLAAGIVARGVEAVCATDAAIGPSIGPCCYEVGNGVLEKFRGLGDGVADGRQLNLPEVARCLLRGAGIERIEVSGLCTSCEAELFFSHRRDEGLTGRQAGLVWRHGKAS